MKKIIIAMAAILFLIAARRAYAEEEVVAVWPYAEGVGAMLNSSRFGCATGLVRCRQHTSVRNLSMIIRKLLRLIVELYLLYINSWIDIHAASASNIDRLMQLDLVLRDHDLLQLRIDLKVHSRRRLRIDLSLVGY